MKKLSNNWHEGKEKIKQEAQERANSKIIGKSWSEKYQKEITIYAGPQDTTHHALPVGFAREFE